MVPFAGSKYWWMWVHSTDCQFVVSSSSFLSWFRMLLNVDLHFHIGSCQNTCKRFIYPPSHHCYRTHATRGACKTEGHSKWRQTFKIYSSKLEAHDHTFSWTTQQIQNLTFSGFLPPHTAHSTVAAHSCWMHQMPQKPPPAFISTIAVKPVGP
jgi:hypothetical protein